MCGAGENSSGEVGRCVGSKKRGEEGEGRKGWLGRVLDQQGCSYEIKGSQALWVLNEMCRANVLVG